MKEFLNFVQIHWKEILEIVLFVATFLVAVLKKSKIDNPQVYDFIMANVVPKILYAEKFYKDGEVKLEYVVDSVMKLVKNYYPNIQHEERYVYFIKQCVETILSTPQKKGIEK